MPAAPRATEPPPPRSPTDELAAEYRVMPETVVGLDTSIEFEGLGENITIGSDSIDETTILETGQQQILLGDVISLNMSTVAADVLNTEYATDFTLTPYAVSAGSSIPGWYSQIQQDLGGDNGFGGCALTSISVNSLYIDQDNGQNNLEVENIPLYGHINYGFNGDGTELSDPVLNDVFTSNTSEELQIFEYVPPWQYGQDERISLKTKFGFNLPDEVSSDLNDQRSVARFHILSEMDSIADLLATGFTKRQGTRKVAQRPDYGDNYELLSDTEQMESTSLVQQIVKTSLPSDGETETVASEAPDDAADTDTEEETGEY